MVANTSSQAVAARSPVMHLIRPPTISAIRMARNNYTLAANLGVTTQIENMAAATQALMTTASTMEANNNVTYKMAIYTFNGSGTKHHSDPDLRSEARQRQRPAPSTCWRSTTNNCLTVSNWQQRHRH